MSRVVDAIRVLLGQDKLQTQTAKKSFYPLMDLYGGAGQAGHVGNQLAASVFGATLAYFKLPAVKSSVDVIAENAASVPIVELDADGNEIARSDTNPNDSYLIKAILDAYEESNVPFIQLWASSRLLYGMTFIEPLLSFGNISVGLKWLNPNNMQIYAPQNEILAFWYDDGGQRIDFKPNEIIYSRAFNPGNDIYGYSATLNAMSKANITLDFDRMTIAYYRNGGQLGMAVSFKEVMGIEEARKLAEFWRQSFKGVDNFFKTHISHIPLDYQQFDPLDISKPLEVSRDAERAIYKAFRVPPEVIGDTENNPYQFSDEKRNAFMQMTVKPVTDAIAMAINYRLIHRFAAKGHTIGFDYSQFDSISETEEKKRTMAEADFRSGVITFNEYRKERNRGAITGGDFLMLPQGAIAIPVMELGQAPDLINKPLLAAGQPQTPQYGAMAQVNTQDANTITVEPNRPAFLEKNAPHYEDLRRWQTKALRCFKSQSMDRITDFESDILPNRLKAAIHGALLEVKEVDNIYTIFDDASQWLSHA